MLSVQWFSSTCSAALHLPGPDSSCVLSLPLMTERYPCTGKRGIWILRLLEACVFGHLRVSFTLSWLRLHNWHWAHLFLFPLSLFLYFLQKLASFTSCHNFILVQSLGEKYSHHMQTCFFSIRWIVAISKALYPKAPSGNFDKVISKKTCYSKTHSNLVVDKKSPSSLSLPFSKVMQTPHYTNSYHQNSKTTFSKKST